MAATPKKTTKKRTPAAVPKAKKAPPSVNLDMSKSPSADAKADEVVVVNRKELLTRVAARLSLRPNEVRTICDAVLAELGEGLLRGEKLKVPPLGVMSVNRKKELPNADVMICKIRRARPSEDTVSQTDSTKTDETAAKTS